MVHPLETILLVDDEETVRRYGSRVLIKHGFGGLFAATGAEALAAAQRHPGPIDLLLTDVMMPGMNGCDLATRLLAERPSLRILFISGYAEDAISDWLRTVGRSAFLGKPFKPKALVTKVREVLDAPLAESSRRVSDIS
jgi:two-component system, cell cycle sensor histidine kinase and response regulator CckA